MGESVLRCQSRDELANFSQFSPTGLFPGPDVRVHLSKWLILKKFQYVAKEKVYIAL
jgi:hypothetical protein